MKVLLVCASLRLVGLSTTGFADKPSPTIDVLERPKAQGNPIEVLLYPTADHGIVEFEENESGARRALRYSETYLRSAIEWLRKQNDV